MEHRAESIGGIRITKPQAPAFVPQGGTSSRQAKLQEICRLQFRINQLKSIWVLVMGVYLGFGICNLELECRT
jgi:hypothetical protein